MARQFSTAQTLANQSAAGVALGVAPGSQASIPAAFEVGEPPRTLLSQKIVVPAYSIYPVVVRGNYVYVESLTYELIRPEFAGLFGQSPTIKPDTGQVVATINKPFSEISFAVPFNNLQVSNPSPNVLTLVITVGFGTVRNDTCRDVKTTISSGNVAATVFAANRNLGGSPRLFQSCCSPVNQRAVIKKAICSVSGSSNTTNADFSLWLTPYPTTAAANNSAFDIFSSFGSDFQTSPPSVIRFPSFVGTGLDGMICVLDGLNIEVFSNNKDDVSASLYPFSLWGIAVTNAAWNLGGIGAAVGFTLVTERG